MHVVLVTPQIPQNTGSIARTCAATNTPLHLIEPLGFQIDEKRVRRAGLDYWPYVDLHIHRNFKEFLKAVRPNNLWPASTRGTKTYAEVDYSGDDALIFGSETKGLGQEFLSDFCSEQIITIPQLSENVRSLNLSNAVSIVLYEALRQRGFT